MAKRHYPNEDMPATAISFKKETLDLLKQIAEREDRSLAAQVRIIIEEWLQSPDGKAAIRKTAQGFDAIELLRLAQNAPPIKNNG